MPSVHSTKGTTHLADIVHQAHAIGGRTKTTSLVERKLSTNKDRSD